MKKVLMSLLVVCMIFTIACVKTNKPVVAPTEAPKVTNEPTIVPTVEPTIEPTVEPTNIDEKTEYYKTYNTSEDFGFISSSAKLELTSEEYTLVSIMYDNYSEWQVGEQSVTMIVKDNKMYIKASILNDENILETVEYTSTIPEGENPLASETENTGEVSESEENIAFTNLVYVETIDYNGQSCDKVTFEAEDSNGFMYVTTDTHKIAYMESIDVENVKTRITYDVQNILEIDIPENVEEIEYEDAKNIYSMSILALLFSTAIDE